MPTCSASCRATPTPSGRCVPAGDSVSATIRRGQTPPASLTFPFPAASEAQQARIRDLAEQLDAHRKRQQAAHESLTLTGMYNVLEKLRSEPLTAKEKTIHEQGLVGVLKTLHDEIDAAVLDAYGWGDLAATLADVTQREAARETLLERLVALNAERAAEEAKGLVRWLRPEFQNPATASAPQQADLPVETGEDEAGASGAAAAPPPASPGRRRSPNRSPPSPASSPIPLPPQRTRPRRPLHRQGPWKSACRRSSTRSKRWGACGGMLPERALCDHVQGSRWPAEIDDAHETRFALPDRAMPSGAPATRLPSEAVFRHRGYPPAVGPRRTTTRDRCRVRLHSVRWRTGQSVVFAARSTATRSTHP